MAGARQGPALLAREMRVSLGKAPRSLTGGPGPEEFAWQLVGEAFLLRTRGEHFYHYERGRGVTIERGPGADPGEEPLWLSGSVYSAVASINGFLPIHASAVCHDGKVHAFTGASGAGKSTLCTALAARGLPLFCDDTLVLDVAGAGPVVCLPGHKRLKLTEEALALTGAAREEQVGREIEKFYAQPHELWTGEPLPLAKLWFLEAGDVPRAIPITGGEKLTRLNDDHYTAMHFTAARAFDARAHFAHLAALAQRVEMRAFARPFDTARFDEGVEFAYASILQP